MGSQSNTNQVLGLTTGVGSIGTAVSMLPGTSSNPILVTLGIISIVAAVAVLASYIALQVYRRVSK